VPKSSLTSITQILPNTASPYPTPPSIDTSPYITATVLSKVTNTPSFPSMYVSEEKEINNNNTASIFSGEIYITLLNSSSIDNHVTAKVFTPGFQELIIDHYSIGDKEKYYSTGILEVQILNIPKYYNSVNFRITYLGSTGKSKRLLAPIQEKTIQENYTQSFFNNDVTITVDKADYLENKYSIRVSTPGVGPVIFEDKEIGDLILFTTSNTYEIRLLHGYNYFSSIDVMVSRIEP
jgi:hypothetical protein